MYIFPCNQKKIVCMILLNITICNESVCLHFWPLKTTSLQIVGYPDAAVKIMKIRVLSVV